jgi:RimJ/RimL family protein N-acetyltransferase
MAAFGAADPADRTAFDARWTRILGDPSIAVRAIETEAGELAGSILLWRDPDLPGPEVSYWLGRPFWGRGIATAALTAFLGEIPVRPLFGRAAADNAGSLRVLEKAGFVRIGEDDGWSDLRDATVREIILRLDA